MSFRIFILAGLIMLFSCSEDKDNTPAETYDLEADFQSIAIDKEGSKDVIIKVAPGVSWTFRTLIPKQVPGEKYPLVLALHGGSGFSPLAHTQTDCYVEEGLAALNAFVLHPNSGSGEWPDVANQQKLASLTLLALKYWPIDSSRVAITGYSNGGNASWLYSELQPQIFTAAVPMASSYNTFDTDSNARKMPVPMYVIHGAKDELFPLAQTRAWVNATKAVGSDIRLVVADSLGHYQPCDYVPYLQDAARWLQDSIWK